MKISEREAARFCAAPGADCAALLLYGESDLVRERREAFFRAAAKRAGSPLDQPERLPGEALQRDGAALDTALRSTGFFAQFRAILVENATDAATAVIEPALALVDRDAALVVEAGTLRAGSKLCKLFETHAKAAAIGCWPSAPTGEAIIERLRAGGVSTVDRETLAALEDLAAGLDRGAFWQEVDKLCIYALPSDGPLTADDVRACGPAATGSDADAALEALAMRDAGGLRAALARLTAKGVRPESTLALALVRFRTLIEAAAVMEAQHCDAETALGRLSPPIRFPRSKPLARQLASWRGPALERGFRALREAQIAVRGASAGEAAVERALIRVALSGK